MSCLFFVFSVLCVLTSFRYAFPCVSMCCSLFVVRVLVVFFVLSVLGVVSGVCYGSMVLFVVCSSCFGFLVLDGICVCLRFVLICCLCF